MNKAKYKAKHWIAKYNGTPIGEMYTKVRLWQEAKGFNSNEIAVSIYTSALEKVFNREIDEETFLSLMDLTLNDLKKIVLQNNTNN